MAEWYLTDTCWEVKSCLEKYPWRCRVPLDPGISKTNLPSLIELPLAWLCAHLHSSGERLLFTSYTARTSGLGVLNQYLTSLKVSALKRLNDSHAWLKSSVTLAVTNVCGHSYKVSTQRKQKTLTHITDLTKLLRTLKVRLPSSVLVVHKFLFLNSGSVLL